MGGGQVSKPIDMATPSSLNDKPNGMRFNYTILCVNPNSGAQASYIVKEEYDEMPLARVMNKLCFASPHSNELKANFASVYNKKSDEFEYYIESMMNFSSKVDSLPVTTSQWYVYINTVKTTWNQICVSDTRVGVSDKLVFSYE